MLLLYTSDNKANRLLGPSHFSELPTESKASYILGELVVNRVHIVQTAFLVRVLTYYTTAVVCFSFALLSEVQGHQKTG